MSRTVSKILAALCCRIPWDRAAEWDPSGLQIGDADAGVERIGVCHEVTELVVRALESDPVDLLITYHPLLFRPTTTFLAGTSPQGRALRLARSGVSVAVAHTAFDIAPGGTADALATALGLDDVGGFGPIGTSGMAKIVTFAPAVSVDAVAAAMAAAGAGRIGNYSGCSFRSEGMGTFFPEEGADPAVGRVQELNREPEIRLEMIVPENRRDHVVGALVAAHPYEEPAYDVYEVRSNMGFVGRIGFLSSGIDLEALAAGVRQALGVGSLRVSGSSDRNVGKVAVVPGSGSSLIPEAARAGADVLVTGDMSHHQTVSALDAGLAVIDPGHIATERPGVLELVTMIRDLDAHVVDLTELDPTPWD